ncbi:MAG: TIGR03013 family XrtA/PEP-CTERM system glycosyltransferase [Steroidobacteraceae bacterium]
MFAPAMIISMTAMGLYAAQQRARTVGVAMRLVAAAMISSVVVTVFVYAFPNIEFGRGVLMITTVISVIGCFVIRLVFMHVLGDDLLKRRVIVYGAGQRAQNVLQLRRRTDQRGFIVVGFLRGSEDELGVPDDKIIEQDRPLYELIRDQNATEVVVALDDQRKGFPVEELLNCRMRGINVVDIVTFLERETGKVRVDMVNPSWMIFSDGFRRDVVGSALERGFDVLASLFLLLLAWPFMLLTALAIKLEDGWSAPVFYGQTRVGFEGRPFVIRKFRSMKVDAEKNGAAWAQKNDPRVSRVGAVIRKLRIDELPQLFNVLVGDMCFVGPRPERPEFVADLGSKIPYYHDRHWVKPGITGWAQLCYPYGSSERDAKEKLQYDLYYVKHRNVVFDLFILLETAEVVLWGKGAR